MATTVSVTAPGAAAVTSWRVTTAVRVCVLALVTGQALSTGTLGQVAPVLFCLLLLAGAISGLELGSARTSPWLTVLDGVVVGTLLTSPLPLDSLQAYLAVPAVVAGVRHGWVATVNTSLSTAGAMTATALALVTAGLPWPPLHASATWLLTGLVSGLVAGWQLRTVRSLEARQAPYAAAHQLVSQLHTLAHTLSLGLDSRTAAGRLEALARETMAATRTSVWVRLGERPVELVSASGSHSLEDAELAERCVARRRRLTTAGATGWPLRVGDHVFGALVCAGGTTRDDSDDSAAVSLQARVDELAVRLDTALLFDEVRSLATDEERHRLAREIHDGVAQEVAALGYLADEIGDGTGDPETRRLADALRHEVTRLVGELRFSIFDLRQQGQAEDGLQEKLSEYLAEVGRQSGLRVHLTVQGEPSLLPRRTEAELSRIAQEAIANVRKHAQAINLWVSLSVRADGVRLVVEDDGSGVVGDRRGHYGLTGMRERAASIGASLTITARPDGGTLVRVTTAIKPTTRLIPQENPQ